MSNVNGGGRSARDIEAELERTRLELSDTIGELTAALNPKTQARVWLDDGKQRVKRLLMEAKAGNKQALAVVLSVAGVVGLFVVAKLRRHL